MKIKLIEKSYDEVMSLSSEPHRLPKKPNVFWRTVMKLAGLPDLLSTEFKCEKVGMEKLERGQACLMLMNHSAFIDLEIAASILYPRPFGIVATTDSFVGKNWLLRQIGCIPTKKFVSELSLIKDMKHALGKGCSVVMFPEAGYTFDGRTTTLPDTLGKLCKLLDSPVVVTITSGAFLRDPLYNNLQKRRVKVSAKMEYLLSPEQVREMSAEDIQALIEEKFSFDGFAEQQSKKIRVAENFRADYLNRVLYKCPHCMVEGKMRGEGVTLTCDACGKQYILDEYGSLAATDGDSKFNHVPDWFEWERDCVRAELEELTYSMDIPVDICMAIDAKKIYSVGEGRLTHTVDGFHLTGCDGKLDYVHTPQASYSINADFNFYEIGDVIALGNHKAIYYCFPKQDRDVVAKARLAAEELYKIVISKKREKRNAS